MAHDEIVELLDRRVRETLERVGLERGGLLIVAVSGGPDSLAMLHALARLRDTLGLRLHGAHLDHRLRGDESAADSDFVATICHGLGLPVTLEQADVSSHRRSEGISLEEAARDLRYEFLARLAEQHGAGGIALGHTADDQTETVLMNIIRGSGLTGLRGMRPAAERIFNGRKVTLIRPLLGVGRNETAEYCHAMGLAPREDSSNMSFEHRRNRVRLELMPLLEEYNPSVRDALRRLSDSATQDLDYLETEVAVAWDKMAGATEGGVVLDRRAVSALAPGLRAHLLRRAVQAAKGDLKDVEQTHIDSLAGLLDGPAGRSLSLPGGVRVMVTYNEAIVTPAGVDPCPLPPLEGPRPLNIPGETVLEGWRVTAGILSSKGKTPPTPQDNRETPDLSRGTATPPETALLDRHSLGPSLCVRPWRPGDRFQPLGMSGTKKLQDFFVDAKVPRVWRDRVPLVVSTRGIAWVVGWRIAEWARVGSETEGALDIRFQRTDLHHAVQPR
jgi:tRNA(Ile)-lysidine synthase